MSDDVTDELMRQIQESLDAAYRRGFDEGWYDGNAAAWGSLAEWAAKQEAAARKTPESSPQDPQDDAEQDNNEQPLGMQEQTEVMIPLNGPTPDINIERHLTPAQQRALDYVRENPGLKSRQLEGIGKGVLYGLVRSGILAKRGAQFYLAEDA